MGVTDDLFLRKVRLTVHAGETEIPYGPNLVVSIVGGHATAAHRRKVRREADVESVEHLDTKDKYAITMTNGEVWHTRGCGCGGG